jgi:hypothetical protein
LLALNDVRCPELTQPVLRPVDAIHAAGAKNPRPPITAPHSRESKNTRRIPYIIYFIGFKHDYIEFDMLVPH